jgi:hypothetical protein
MVSPRAPGHTGLAGAIIRAPAPPFGQLRDGASVSFLLLNEKIFIFHDGTVAFWHAMGI